MRNLNLIIKREYLSRVRNKTFVIMTFLSPLILVGMVMLVAYLAMLNNEGVSSVAFIDESQIFENEFQSTEEVKFIDLSALSLEEGKKVVEQGEYIGLLHIAEDFKNSYQESQVQFFSKETPDFSIMEQLERRISEKATNLKLLQNGVNLEKLKSSETSISINIQNFSGEQTSKISSYIKMFFGGAAGYLLMMFIIVYGNMVMRSVIEEKTNRIVEIIISSVKPVQLMWGKILGTSLAGITQFLIWVILGGILLNVAASISGLEMTSMQSTQQQAIENAANNEAQQLIVDILNLPLLTLVICFFIYFIGGYFLYSAIYAAIGAAVDNETDTQQFMFPIILPLMLGIYVGFFSVIENPHGTVSTIFSMIPLTSPIVMLMRIPFGVPFWEILLSIAILIITIIGVVWIAAKIYKIGILMYGKKPSYKDLFKWLKY